MESNSYLINSLLSIENMILNNKNPILLKDQVDYINSIADSYIRNSNSLNEEQLNAICIIIRICNLIYTNVPNKLSPLDDIKYDYLINICKKYDIQYPIGAPKIDFDLSNIEEDPSILYKEDKKHKYIDGKLEIVKQIENVNTNYVFFKELNKKSSLFRKEDFIINHNEGLVNKRIRETQSEYNLCGTLNKCKYVTIEEAINKNEESIDNVGIFTRDFLNKHILNGIVDRDDITLILSLKYDGISIENTMRKDTIIRSYTRGDVIHNIVSDMTPVFGGMKFARASSLNNNTEFGIKFEYIITNYNMELIKKHFNKEYVNNRNAVSGLTNGLDAIKYRDYLTPIPLESSLNMSRIEEIEFLNKYYTKGIEFKYVIIRGHYDYIIDSVIQFMNEVNSLRDYFDFMIDGIVVEYAVEEIRNKLGKKDGIPKYAIAIKFDPPKKVSTFKYYTFTVGSDGRITPMAHFDPVEILGATHSYTTAHSYERFMKLGLHTGDKVELSLRNDVILYINRLPDSEQDPNNHNPLFEFPTHCPSCNTPLQFTDTNKIAYCPNIDCPERKLYRLTNMIKKLGIKDFSMETLRALKVNTFKELCTLDKQKVLDILGPVRGLNLLNAIEELMQSGRLYDYQIFGSIGFTNIAEKTWKLILKYHSIDDILNKNNLDNIVSIKGIGNSCLVTILNEIDYYKQDLMYIFDNASYQTSTGVEETGLEVVFTGIRDKELENILIDLGYRVSETLSSDTSYLIVPRLGHLSTKVKRIFKIFSRKYEVLNNTNIEIDWSNLDLIKPYGFKPEIIDFYTFKSMIMEEKNIKNNI